jgi:hypothetical protein
MNIVLMVNMLPLLMLSGAYYVPLHVQRTSDQRLGSAAVET